MRDAIGAILQLVADGVIGPDDAQTLLDALMVGYPEEFQLRRHGGPSHPISDGVTVMVPRGREPVRGEEEDPFRSGPRGPTNQSVDFHDSSTANKTEGWLLDAPTTGSGDTSTLPPPGLGADRVGYAPDGSPESASRPAQGGSRPVQGVSGMDRDPKVASEPTPSEVQPGHSVGLPPGVLLRVESSAYRQVPEDALTSLAIRGTTAAALRVVQGEHVEVNRDGPAWHLTWSGGMLFLEVPSRLAGLEIRHIPGSVGLSAYSGPFSVEEISGGLTVRGASSPFRIRGVRGAVRLLGLALRDGISTVAAVARDLEIETTREASVTVRASSQGPSRPTDSDDLIESDAAWDQAGRRGVWRVGAGTAQLNISQVRGQLRLHATDDAENDSP